MRCDLIRRVSLSASDSVNVKVSKGHLNGIVIYTSKAVGDAVINARRRTASKTFLLANNMLASDLVRISEQDNGFGFGESSYAETMAKLLITKLVFTQAEYHNGVELYTGQRGLQFLYIDLGSLFLDSDNELDFTFTMPNDGSMVNVGVGLYAVSQRKSPDNMKQYDQVLDFDTTHHGVDSIYLSSPAGFALLNVDEATDAVVESPVQVTIIDDDDVAQIDAAGLIAATAIFGNNGGMADQHLVRVYRRRDPLPADVYVKVGGVVPQVGPNGWYLVVVRNLYDLFSTAQNTVSEAQALAGRIATLEVKDPQTAAALRHSGLIVTAAQLNAAIAQSGG